MATRTQNVLGEKGRRIRELTSLVQKRFNFPEGTVELYAEKVATRGLCAIAQAESLRYKLIGGLAARRACYGVLRFIMESGAKGCEVVVSGKLRGQRAKAMKFVDGLMIHSGDPSTLSSIALVREDIEGVLPGHLAPGKEALIAMIGHNCRHVEDEICRILIRQQVVSILIYLRVFCGWVYRVNHDVLPIYPIKILLKNPGKGVDCHFTH